MTALFEKLNEDDGDVSVDLVKNMDETVGLKRNFDRPPLKGKLRIWGCCISRFSFSHFFHLKDTVTIPEGGYTIIRFVADNPGVWFFHCHLDFHSEIGMGFLLRVGTENDLPPKPKNWQQCGSFIDN